MQNMQFTTVVGVRLMASSFAPGAQAFPEAAVMAPGGHAMQPVLRELHDVELLRPGTPLSSEQAGLLSGFSVEVVDCAGVEEIILLHELTRTLLVADFVLFGSDDPKDAEGWPKLSSKDWTRLHFQAHCATVQSVLLPSYRLGLCVEDRGKIASSLKRIQEWRPSQILGAHAGKISEGGPGGAAKLLEGSWGWCGIQRPQGVCCGDRVRLVYLQAALELNGTMGTALDFDVTKGRWRVRLDDGREKSLQPENLDPG
eukprot:gnl/TRDRNA2_/TRDRNA2_155533_c1_seq2.p1 gnl/TRDRNA2_/TRDRNA2_155533_c1~~gnl/TRDRNA2_/TRDRNA2_155533_c1_seq2.p1  ORF type:complete len:256 (-),score=35.83 gnl/TRDRNA2_/TRDRNA2_155533_c1_seq2:528-1295(-)